MAVTQIRGSTQIMAGTIFDAQIAASAAISTSKLADGANFLKKDGSVVLTGNLDLGNNKLINLAAPTANGDAVNKSYVDTLDAANFKKDGSRVATGHFDLGSFRITNLGAPSAASDATTKNYVDTLDAANFKKDGSVAATGNFNLASNKITNLGAPSAAGDAVNKSYVDAVASGLDVKASVRAASTANLTLSGTQTVDGVALIAGDRVLVKNQTTGSENGIYVVASGAWSRASDADSDAEVTAGMFCFIEEGSSQADTGWVLVTDNPVTLGTTSLSFSQFTDTGNIQAGAGLTKTGNTLDVVSANGGIVVNADNIALTLADASLAIVSGGLKIASGTAGQVLVANASGVPITQTLSGDVSSVTGTGVVTLAGNIVREADFVDRETPSGAVNGTNTSFSLANTPISGSEHVYLNGLLLESGAGNDYTVSGSTITMASAPSTGDKLRVTYRK